MLVSQAKFAKTIGTTQQYVSKLIKKGVLKNSIINGKIHLDKGIKELKVQGLLDENNKYIKRNPGKPLNSENEKSLFTSVNYKSLADMSKEEREEYERERKKAIKEAQDIAKKLDSTLPKELQNLLDSMSLTEAKTFTEIYRGKIAELDYLKKTGELIERSEINSELEQIAKIMRDNFLNLPLKVAPFLVGEKDQIKIEKKLRQEIEKILSNLEDARRKYE